MYFQFLVSHRDPVIISYSILSELFAKRSKVTAFITWSERTSAPSASGISVTAEKARRLLSNVLHLKKEQPKSKNHDPIQLSSILTLGSLQAPHTMPKHHSFVLRITKSSLDVAGGGVLSFTKLNFISQLLIIFIT